MLKRIFVLIILLLTTTKCSFVTADNISKASELIEDVVFKKDSIEITTKEFEVYYELNLNGQYGELKDDTLANGAKLWVYRVNDSTILFSTQIPSKKIRIKK